MKTNGGDDAATTIADAAFIIKDNAAENEVLTQTDFTYADDGSVEFGISTSKFDNELTDFEEIVCPRKLSSSGGGDVEELTGESGAKIGGDNASDDTVYLLALSVGSIDGNGKRPLSAAVGYIKKSTKRSYVADKWVQTPLKTKCNLQATMLQCNWLLIKNCKMRKLQLSKTTL